MGETGEGVLHRDRPHPIAAAVRSDLHRATRREASADTHERPHRGRLRNRTATAQPTTPRPTASLGPPAPDRGPRSLVPRASPRVRSGAQPRHPHRRPHRFADRADPPSSVGLVGHPTIRSRMATIRPVTPETTARNRTRAQDSSDRSPLSAASVPSVAASTSASVSWPPSVLASVSSPSSGSSGT